VFYCNRKCQRIAWKSGHKHECKYTATVQAIHAKLARDFTVEVQDKKTKQYTASTPAQNRKAMLERVVWWYAEDNENGMTFSHFSNMIDDLVLTDGVTPSKTRWKQWRDVCRKHGLGDPNTAHFNQDEIWAVLLDFGQATVAMKNQLKEMSDPDEKKDVELESEGGSAYGYAFWSLLLLWSTVRDHSALPFAKQEICQAIASVTPLLGEIADVVHSYVSDVIEEFAIGDCDLQWMHDHRNTKPLPLLLQKYQELELDAENQRKYGYDVVYLRNSEDVRNMSGKIVAVVDVVEITIRIEDCFGVVDSEQCKEHTFVLGTSIASRMCFLFRMADHAELVTKVLKLHGLDLQNIRNFYVGKRLFGTNPKMQDTLVEVFNQMNGCNADRIDEIMAHILGTFSESAYNIDKARPIQPQKQTNLADIFQSTFETLNPYELFDIDT